MEKGNIREEEGEGKEEEMDESHVHQCLDAHFDTEFFIFFPSKSFKAWARCC